jgi:hypothetical protein
MTPEQIRASLSPVLLLLMASVAAPAIAAPPDACSLLSVDDINKLAKGGDAVRAEKKAGGAESQCNFMKQGGDNVANITLREVADAAAEFKFAAQIPMKMYKKPVKPITGVGDEAFWADNQQMIVFRKGKTLVHTYFGGDKYGGEPNTVALAKAVAAKLK